MDFVCIDYPEIPEHIDAFSDGDTLFDKLDLFVAEIINAKVNIDSIQGEFLVPKVF